MDSDDRLYEMSVRELMNGPVKAAHGVYSLYNGTIMYNGHTIGSLGFAMSEHPWNILH